MIATELLNKHNSVILGDAMEDESKEGLKAAAEDILAAVEKKDVSGLVSALEAFFYMCDEMPHEEGGEVSPVSEVKMAIALGKNK